LNGKNQELAENPLLTGDPPEAEAGEATTIGKASIAGPANVCIGFAFLFSSDWLAT
jgi:hypothetical protein